MINRIIDFSVRNKVIVDVHSIEQIGTHIESVLPAVKGTRSVFAERTGSGYFLNFDWNRQELARYGLSIAEVQEVIANAIGEENVTTAVEGRERYNVNVRYQRDFRSISAPWNAFWCRRTAASGKTPWGGWPASRWPAGRP
jgi:Cu/Ag efflux pump CusA